MKNQRLAEIGTHKKSRRHSLKFEDLEVRKLLSASQFGEFDVPVEKGQPAAEVRIIGGAPANTEYPFMVSLQSGGWHFCGGSLISPNTVLTAAHCVESSSTRSFDVVIGRSDLSSTEGQRVDVSQIHIHPNYDTYSIDSDIAVVRLAESVSYEPTSYATPSDSHLFAPGIDSTIMGWGQTEMFGSSPDKLHEATVPIVSNEVANSIWSYDGSVTDNMLAAGFAEGGVDSCYGDSGGPLLVTNESGEFLQAGIVSWGYGCAEPDAYGIYTRVENFSEWIDQAVAGNWPTIDGPTIDSPATVNLDETVSGNINFPGDVDSFSFSAEAGTSYVAEISGGSLSRGVAGVFSADGRTIQSMRPDQVSFTATESGVYHFDVTGASTATGDYQLTVREVQDDHPGPIDATPMSSDDFSVEGNIEISNDVDWFSFEAEAGQIYEVEVHLGTLFDSVLSVYDQAGNSLEFDDDGGIGWASKLEFTPSVTGTYFVEVAGWSSWDTGSYSLTVGPYVPPPITSLPPGDVSIEAELEAEFEVDYYSLQVEAGQEYAIDVDLVTLPDSTLTVYDSSGFLVDFNDDHGQDLGSHVTLRPESSDQYVIEVSGYFGWDTGSYILVIDELITFGDIDGDGELTANDIDQLNRAVNAGIVIAHFDVNQDGNVDHGDVTYLVEEFFGSTIGDVNFDGTFDSADLVQLFTAAQFQDNQFQNSSWLTGDWNGDREFDTADLVLAMQSPGFESLNGPAENIPQIIDGNVDDLEAVFDELIGLRDDDNDDNNDDDDEAIATDLLFAMLHDTTSELELAQLSI